MPPLPSPGSEDSDNRRKFQRRRRLVAVSAGLLLALVVLLLIQLNPDFRPRDLIAALREAGPWVFFAAMGLLPVLGFPLAPFNVAAGPAFAPSLGVVPVVALACVAIALNVSLTYWLAKYMLRPLVARAAAWLGYTIPVIPSDKQLAAAFLVRATPGPPFFLQSCLLGVAGVPYLPYMIASCSIPGLYAALVIIGGDAFMSGKTGVVLLCCAALGLIATVLRLLRKKSNQQDPR